MREKGDLNSGGSEGEDAVPVIDLRIPGPWGAPEELEAALQRTDSAFEVTETGFVHVPSGREFHCGVSPHDDEIHEIFAHDGRLSRQQVKQIASHRVKVHLSGPGGSPEAARQIMDAATALVRAGGYGVMVDNSGNTHGVDDWLALAGDKQPGGLYWAFVGAAGSDEEVWSAGMHCLGFRDAEVSGGPGKDAMGYVLHNFLGYAYQSGNPILDGDPLGDEASALFRARAYPCTRFEPGTPFYNPYGIWRLEPIDDGD